MVVMAHGFSATITMTTDRYAEVFAAHGLAVLLYDHRGFGRSGGEPRHSINPWVQARGYRDALTCAASLPGVDGQRVALWGDSFSGSVALVVAGVDDRVAAVVVQAPATGWENRATRVTPRTPVPFHAGLAAPHIRCPALVQLSPDDEMAGADPVIARAVAESIAGPTEIREIDGGHFGLLHYPSQWFDDAVRTQVEFFARAFAP